MGASLSPLLRDFISGARAAHASTRRHVGLGMAHAALLAGWSRHELARRSLPRRASIIL